MNEKYFFCRFSDIFLARRGGRSYLCNVFFIVLDLRLTRLGYSGIPFFFALFGGEETLEGTFLQVYLLFLPQKGEVFPKFL